MSEGAKNLIAAFDELPAAERAEVVRELLRRATLDPHEPLADEELLQAADEIFLDLDRRETET